MLRPRRLAAPVTSTVRRREGEGIRETIGRVTNEPSSLTSALRAHIVQDIRAAGGWIGFDRFMQAALYAPGLGYYANESPKFGAMPGSGSDFVTAPELSPVFGRVLAAQVREALDATGTHDVWEFGAGSGVLAAQLLEALGERVRRYTIVDLSGSLRARQQARLAPFGDRVAWAGQLPEALEGVVVGNEVLDAMPVQLLHRRAGTWHERGVVWDGDGFVWEDRATALRPPVEIGGLHDYLTEIHLSTTTPSATWARWCATGRTRWIPTRWPTWA